MRSEALISEARKPQVRKLLEKLVARMTCDRKQLFYLFKMLRAHILPLTNCAFNKSGDKYVFLLIEVALLRARFGETTTLSSETQIHHRFVRQKLQSMGYYDRYAVELREIVFGLRVDVATWDVLTNC